MVAALVRETGTIPIVFINVADPIGSGFVANLSRPDGNLTGFTTDNSELGGKWVELLKAIAQNTMRIALLFNPATVVPLKTYMPSIHAAAHLWPYRWIQLQFTPRTRLKSLSPHKREMRGAVL